MRLGLCCTKVHHETVFGVAISYFIGYYQVALETGTKFVPQNGPTMQFDTTPPQSYAEPPRAQLAIACVAGAWK